MAAGSHRKIASPSLSFIYKTITHGLREFKRHHRKYKKIIKVRSTFEWQLFVFPV